MGIQTEQATARTAAPTPADVVVPAKCDEPGCEEIATHSYTWDWGQSGNACAKHAALLGQRAENLQRKVSVHPLQAAGPVPLTRDERIKLRVANEVLAAEIDEVKKRGLDLYNDNVNLTKQIQTLTLREREAKAQLADAAKSLEAISAKLDERDAAHAELVDEVQRLRTLAKFVDEQTTPAAQPTQQSVD